VRHGGLPDWLLAAAGEVRADDPVYLTATRKFYAQIATQLRGLLWKDGGPVFGVQIENEYAGPAAHLLTLKQMALDSGLDVPLKPSAKKLSELE
jgi:beta-galactosidase